MENKEKNKIRFRYHNLLNNTFANKEIIEIENEWEKEFWDLIELRKPLPQKIKRGIELKEDVNLQDKKFYKHLAGSRKLIDCFQIPTEELEQREIDLFDNN